MTADDYVHAARVPLSLQPQTFGDWTIHRVEEDEPIMRTLMMNMIGFPMQTVLYRWTLATLHQTYGDVVMEDSERELRKHLPIWMHGRGRVLVTGLGLGCVVRGLLHSPRVDHIDVVELDADILRIVGAEFAGNDKVTLHHGDALTYQWPESAKWDCAWHDLWTEDGVLQHMHVELMIRMQKLVPMQGAWNFPKFAKRLCNRRLLR